MLVPTMSLGIRSGVNWMRLKVPPTSRAIVRASSVFAVPGTPSISRCPRRTRAMNERWTASSWPITTRWISPA